MLPHDPDTMLTAMKEAQKLTNDCGQKVTIFTLDQQLYRISLIVKWEYQDEFKHFIPRLRECILL